MLRPAHLIQCSVVALLGLGVIMVHSAGASVFSGTQRTSDAGSLAQVIGFFNVRTVCYALAAVGAMLLASRINVRQMFSIYPVDGGADPGFGQRVGRVLRHGCSPLWWMVALSLGLSAALMIPGLREVVGHEVNGARRWIKAGPLTFQPSELVKWVMVLAVAWWCARRRFVMHRFRAGLLPPLLLTTVACGVVVVEDLGTAALVGLVLVCMLLAGGARWWQLAMFAGAGVAGLVVLIVRTPYRMQRMISFMDPWADPAGAGYHPIQSMLAFAQGGLQGRGLGQSIQKYYIPEDTTDFIFPVLVEELGLPGAALVIALVLTILWVGLGIVRDCRDTFGRLVGLGVLLTFGCQAAMNIAVVTVVVPTKGIALPLVSSGGTGWVLCAFSLGLVAALDNANHLAALGESDLVVAELDEPAEAALPGRAPGMPAA